MLRCIFLLLLSFNFKIYSQEFNSNAHFLQGKVIDSVYCKSNNHQSYALYLPSSYSIEKKWPIILIYSPSGNGKLAIEKFIHGSEKYGYILAATNNFKNENFELALEASNAVIKDVFDHFSINENRIYTAGTFGGANAALSIANITDNMVAGVLLCNTTNSFSDHYEINEDSKLDIVILAALKDRHLNEILEYISDLESKNVNNKIIFYKGKRLRPAIESITRGMKWLNIQYEIKKQTSIYN